MEQVRKQTRNICIIAMGVALYCALSMFLRIPTGIGHIALDLGYVVLTVYAYNLGSVKASLVGSISAGIVSLLNGWFSLEQVFANLFIGFICGKYYKKIENKKAFAWDILVTVLSVGVGMLFIKTITSYILYATPILVKLPKSISAWIIDSIVMSVSLPFAHSLNKKIKIK